MQIHREWFRAPALLVLFIGLSSAVARADEMADLRAQLTALKSDYEARIAALEQRLAALEAAPPATPAVVPAAVQAENAPPPLPADSAAAPVAAVGGGGQSAFNPAVSVILAGSYRHLELNPANYRIGGFVPSGDSLGPGRRGFTLGESELTFAANVDPYFSANLTASLDDGDAAHVEEAYFKTLGLPAGLLLKGGRFFSGVGYLNEVHAHAWDFVDQPLIYQALFNGQLAQDGAQLRWLAPTTTFVEFGAEAGNGREFPGADADSNSLRSIALFAHLGNDIGDSASWRAGISALSTEVQDRSWASVDAGGLPVLNAFTGRSETWGTDFTYKWAPHGNATERQLKLQGEYLHRRERGTLAFDVNGLNAAGAWTGTQSGWYLQGTWQFRPRWRTGLRYDALQADAPAAALVSSGAISLADLPDLMPATPHRTSLMLDWSPSEFSRLRLQYALDAARRAADDHELFLQYLFSIGAHGAHKF